VSMTPLVQKIILDSPYILCVIVLAKG
jgi:hypothetical protein